MSTINPTDFSFLANQDFKTLAKEGKKIALHAGKVVWLSNAEMEKPGVKKLSIKTIAEIARGIKVDEFKGDHKELFLNLNWLNRKITKSNKKIEENFITKCWNAVLSFFSMGKLHLTTETLDETIEKTKPFGKHIDAKSLNKIIQFVEEQWLLIQAGIIGHPSKSRPNIRKFSPIHHQIFFNFEYNKDNGDLIVKLGELGKGTFKTVKKQLNLPYMEMEAPGKQEKGEVSAQELKMMEAAKGLPHVIDLKEVTEHISKKKGRQTVTTNLHFYNMGGLDRHLSPTNPTLFTNLELYQIASDMIKGVVELHDRGIIHRDIKPANIFLEKVIENGNEVVHAIVGDLGLSCFSENDPIRLILQGSPLYIPPEILNGADSNFDQDAWAVAATFSEIFFGVHPLETATDISHIITLGKELGNNPMPADQESIEYVIWKLMRPDPKERMALVDALVIIDKNLEAEKART